MELSSTIDEQSILGTPITWEIIEKDFQEAYTTTAKTGDKREAKGIGGGMGYVSKLAHVFFDWTTDHDRLPKEAVVKITIPVSMQPVRFENGPFELDDRKDLDKKALQMIEKFPDLKEEIEKYVTNYDKVYRDYKRFMEIRKNTCISQILCQGDVWTPNILWDLDEEGRFHVRALVDWQLVHVGSPLEDLVFLLHSACSVDDHEKHLEKFLLYYYSSLESRLNGGETMPWQSFEEFKNKYEIAYGYMCGLIWPMTWMVDLEKSCTHETGLFWRVLPDKTMTFRGDQCKGGKKSKESYYNAC